MLCWYGIINNKADAVLDFCETAAGRNPPNLVLRENLAIARVLAGNRELAIQDFEFILAEAKRREAAEVFIQRQEKWLEALRAGQNPFTGEVLNALQEEKGQQ